MEIGERKIGDDPFIVAEMSCNHKQSYKRACEIIETAADCGADAVKVQMFTPDSLTLNRNDWIFIVNEGPWAGMTLWDLYTKACMPIDWIPSLKVLAQNRGMEFFASVYDVDMVDVAESMGLCAYKISSFEAEYTPLLERVAKTGKPVLVSTGGLEYCAVGKIPRTIKKRNLILLKCVSKYPAPLEEFNLRTLFDMSRTFTPFVGLSDHSIGSVASICAVCHGASVIEKHFCIDGTGLDGAFSILPDDFKRFVKDVKDAKKTIGKVVYGGDRMIKREIIDGKNVRTVR